jgi:hypothetical protein
MAKPSLLDMTMLLDAQRVGPRLADVSVAHNNKLHELAGWIIQQTGSKPTPKPADPSHEQV